MDLGSSTLAPVGVNAQDRANVPTSSTAKRVAIHLSSPFLSPLLELILCTTEDYLPDLTVLFHQRGVVLRPIAVYGRVCDSLRHRELCFVASPTGSGWSPVPHLCSQKRQHFIFHCISETLLYILTSSHSRISSAPKQNLGKQYP